MNKYNLRILTYTGYYEVTIEAKNFSTQTSHSSSGYYAFFDDTGLISCYPIDKTIIESIDYNK